MQTKQWSPDLSIFTWWSSAIRTRITRKLYSLDDGLGPLPESVCMRQSSTNQVFFLFLTCHWLHFKQEPSKSPTNDASWWLCLLPPLKCLQSSSESENCFRTGTLQWKRSSGRGPKLSSREYKCRIMQVPIALIHQATHLDHCTYFVCIN